MPGIKTRVFQLGFYSVGRIDAGRLKAHHPLLVPNEADWASLRGDLSSAYKEYVAEVSTAGMAASLETGTYLYHLCRAVRATSVLDLGSGFSSYVLRRYARDAPYAVAVTSVDDDAQWLGRTADFLRHQNCDVHGLAEWSEYRDSSTGPHSVVFHDLAGGQAREAAMPFAVSEVAPNGLIVLDDAQHVGHRERMYSECSSAGMRLYSLRRRTLDSVGRWAVLGVASQFQSDPSLTRTYAV